MTTQHTQGRLTLELVESDSGAIRHLCPVDKDGLSVLTVVEHEGVKFAAVYLDDDARRLVACWNACDGISTERLNDLERPLMKHLFGCDERAARMVKERDELLAALMEIATTFYGGNKFQKIARAAIAKATGGQK